MQQLDLEQKRIRDDCDHLGLGYDVSAFGQPIAISENFGDEDRKIRIRVNGSGLGRIILYPATMNVDLTVDWKNTSDNTIVLAGCKSFAGHLSFMANGCRAVFGRGWLTGMKCIFADDRTSLLVGDNASIGGSNIWLQGEGEKIAIGNDCMLAWSIDIRTGDAHGVISVHDRRRTNLTKSVAIGPHVWIAPEVNVMKGVQIGAGSIIGHRSVVTNNLPAMSLCLGAPASVKKMGLTWTRNPNPTKQEIDDVLSRKYMNGHI